jgi:hypothetical protein
MCVSGKSIQGNGLKSLLLINRRLRKCFLAVLLCFEKKIKNKHVDEKQNTGSAVVDYSCCCVTKMIEISTRGRGIYFLQMPFCPERSRLDSKDLT